MVQIGKWNQLKVVKEVSFGVYLDGQEEGEILLPAKEVPKGLKVGDSLDVFLCFDSEDRLISTTSKPLAEVGQFAVLRVVSVETVGAFLDWGLPKDLFLPYAEQSRDLRPGQEIIVYLYLDKTTRIAASMRLERNLEKTPGELTEGQEVDLLLFGRTDLGFKAIINGKHLGVLYENEVFQKLDYAQSLKGFIKKIRDDGKIDLTLQRAGHEAANEDIGPLILKALEKNGGYLEINDKASAETIHRLFGVSKKKFKIALGGLYKKRLITVNDDGIRLV
ncbi:MAG: GntR family transcriptional regulator [Bdellovibrionaceae bacterium]|nr:GntR family transcriptional regulator [Pseudobdellovibrionaceae bacterium]